MKVHVRYFAAIREALGVPRETLETQAIDLAGLRQELVARGGPAGQVLAQGQAVRMALDQVLCDGAARLKPECEVAFFPPVTGG